MNAEAALALRPDLEVIAGWIRPGERVLDLGCGDGSLLKSLVEQRGARGYGVELDPAKVLASVQTGINVIQGDLEAGLAGFRDGSFDHVILSLTLQAMHRTEYVVAEMLRVGREAIVTFPNFAHWRNRLSVLAGRMPVSEALPYEWYNSPNVRFFTIADFDVFLRERHCAVIERRVLNSGRRINWLPNLRGSIAVYRIRRDENH